MPDLGDPLFKMGSLQQCNRIRSDRTESHPPASQPAAVHVSSALQEIDRSAMNTASKTVSKLLISEAKTLDTFGIISPLVETTTSSSTATIESTTAQISSKSSSPFNALAFKESPKLSPLSESTVSPTQLGAVAGGVGDATSDARTQRILKSPISPVSKSARTSPADSPIPPFLGETLRKQQQDEVLQQQQNENMLTSTSGSSNSSQQSTGAGTAASVLTTSVSSPTNSINNIKCEPYTALSPLNENANSQHLLDEGTNNNNNNGSNNSTGSNNNVAMDTMIKRERDCATGVATAPPSAASILRQNSNNSMSSLPPANAASPHNGSDHSNSSNISSNVSQAIEGSTTELLQDLNADKSAKKKSNMNNTNVKEEDHVLTPPPDKASSSTTPSSSTAVKNALCTTPTLSSLSAVKEEPDVMNNLINVKKEEGNVSPDMSPVGFGSIANLSGGSSAEPAGRAGTPVKLNDLSAANAGNSNSSNSAQNSSNNNNEKLTSVLGSTGSGVGQSCADDSVAGGNNSNLGSATNETCSGLGAQHPVANVINSSNSGGCMEYMQQQNHIFVFSTQLANKGAESVLSGQFPTIIAYHCTQPATKSFLEDFFMKNPMKMSKLQRQNSFNLCNISVVGGQQWLGGGGCNPKMPQKSNNKINFGGLGGNMESKAAQRPPNIPAGFGDAADTLSGTDSELMCWEQTRNSLENATAANEPHPTRQMPDGAEQVVGCHGSNKPMCAADASGDSSTPSLQGIKVPDENLTPQQRQHREEQLAKLKQIDQFLSNPLQGANQLGKLGGDVNVPGNIAGIMINLPGAGPGGMGPQINNPLNPNMRNMPPNVMGPNSQGLCNPDNLPPALGDSAIAPSEMMGGHDMGGGLSCNSNKGPCGTNITMNNQQALPCGSSGVIGGALAPGVNIGNMPGNPMSCHAGGGGGGAGSINGPGGLMPNSPEMMSGFNQNCGGEGNLNGAGVKALSAAMHAQDMNQVGMAQMEWSKLQHQFFEERMKGGPKSLGGPNDIGCIPAAALCRSNAPGMTNVNVMRPNLSGACVAAMAPSGSSQSVRTAQGPPPPYHPTQRSASVPIATQSPNPASPNNPTSNLSLPSPRTSGALGIPANSPNMDVHVSQMSAATSLTITSATTTTAATISTTISNANAQTKGNFSQEGSPTGGNNSAVGGGGNSRNRNSLNQFNSNPSTPLSHMSPKDLDTFHTNVAAGDLKNARPSPQRSRTPLIAPNSSQINEAGAIESRFPSASPGLNFPSHMQNAPGGGVNSYKGPGPLERQNSAPVSSQFCRRTDNLPLNPNSNRPPPNKLNHSFDPISSLAQMSQQLTSCVSLNAGGVGSSPGGMGVIGINDMNMPNNVNPGMDGMMGAMDAAGMDHCSPGAVNNMGMPGHIGGAAPFLANNCHINSMLGPMGQRLLNPKMCGGFNPTNGGMRDTPGNMHGVMPSHRMMGRMAVNFGNFNVSPNIQVKASTPNTIQYMPVRPQNSNSTNMRVPPSLEFLQRYANPQLAGGGNSGNVLDNGHLGPGPNGHNELNKIGNCNSGGPGGGNPPGMNFFGNCNQLGGIMGEQEDMGGGGNMLPGHDMSMSAAHGPMIRGMRPMRQHSLGHAGNQVVSGPRMQAPGGPPNIGGPVMPSQFGGAPPDAMECGDGGMFVGGSAPGGSQGSGPGQMFAGGVSAQQKPAKGGGGLCQNMNVVGGGGAQGPSGGMLQQEHSGAMQSPVNGPLLMGPNSGIMPNQMPLGNTSVPVTCGSNGPGGGGGNYKAFVGPAANDLKYAQQFHSFQQQLYATSTRSQQGAGNANMGNNPAPNPSFFVNK